MILTRDSYSRRGRRRGPIPGHPAAGAATPGIVTSGLLADYQFAEGSGTQLTDHSGNGNHGTLGTGGNAPSWIAGGLRFTNTDQWVNLPSALNSFGAVQIFWKPDANQQPYPVAVGMTDNGNWGLWLKFFWDNYTTNQQFESPGLQIWGANFGAYNYGWCTTPSVVGWTNDGTTDQFYLNAEEPYYAATGTSTVGGRTGGVALGGAPFYGGNGQVGFLGNMYRAVFYGRALSQQEINQNFAVMQSQATTLGMSMPAYNPATANRVYAAQGDSITFGLNIGNPWPMEMTTTQTYERRNFGYAGETMQHMSVNGYDLIKYYYAAGAPKNVVSIFGGTNDLTEGTTPAATFGYLSALAGKYLAQGWLVVVVPTISRTPNGGTAIDPLKDAYNALIWGYSWPANVRVIQANDAFIGSGAAFNFFADGSYTNSTYYQGDGTHPTQAGANLIGQAVAAQINAFG